MGFVRADAGIEAWFNHDAEAWEMLTDAEQHEVLPVTLAEEMAVAETFELVGRLEAMGMTARHVVVNKLLPPLFTNDDEARLDGLQLEGSLSEVVAAGQGVSKANSS